MHQPGTVLDKRYRVENLLGQGGMGNVYLARQMQSDRLVAVKEMHVATPENRESALRQFRHEAKVLCELSHPCLPQVLDFFEIDGAPHLVMEYLKGRSLSAVLDAEEEPLSEKMVRQWAEELCVLLEYLHGHDPPVVFRDLKPANIILDVDGRIKLIDFGISKIFDGPASATHTFAKGAVSAGFTAPEQYAGVSDTRSDIYSLGATLYCLLSGMVPPSAVERAADIVMLLPLQSLRPDISPKLAAGIDTLMEVRAAERPGNIAEARRALGLTASGEPEAEDIPSQPALSIVEAVPSGAGRGPLMAVAVLVVGVVAWLVWTYLFPHPPPIGEGGVPTPTSPTSTGPLPAEMRITSHPPGAKVSLDGKDKGTTPLDLRGLAEGHYWVQVSKEGYSSGEADVTLAQGEEKDIDIPLVRSRSSLQIQGYPEGTQLVVDGNKVPLNPGSSYVDLGTGRHKLAFSHPGYRLLVRYVTVDQNQPMPLSITMEPDSDHDRPTPRSDSSHGINTPHSTLGVVPAVGF